MFPTLKNSQKLNFLQVLGIVVDTIFDFGERLPKKASHKAKKEKNTKPFQKTRVITKNTFICIYVQICTNLYIYKR